MPRTANGEQAERAGPESRARDPLELPLLEVEGAPLRALEPEVLSRLGPQALEGWLLAARWFGAKGRGPLRARIRDSIPLFAEDPPSAVVRTIVETASPGASVYQILLALRPEAPREARPLARVRAGGRVFVAFDALEDESFRDRLGRCFAAGAVFPGREAAWVVQPFGELGRRAIPPGSVSRVLRGEQSNTSVAYGEAAILKLFRRLEEGENPETEIARALAAAGSFPHVPRLYGTVHFEDAGGSRSAAAQLSAFVGGARDGWTYARERLWAELRGEPGRPFAEEAYRLGEVTRALHEALASIAAEPAFVPEPATEADVARWAESARTLARALSGRLDPLRFGGLVDAVDRRLERLVRRIGSDAGSRIRHHGDYHLGQVLRTADGDFVVLDFEGEPVRSLAERRQRHSPLRDVAGMLRSFDYAAASAVREDPSGKAGAELWRNRVREAFLRGYRSSPRSGILPRTEAAFASLCDLFEIEKALYEVGYELEHRPSWVEIPLEGLRTLGIAAGRPS